MSVIDRRHPAPRMVSVVVAGLLLGGLLNARPLSATAESQPPGWKRTVAVAATDALLDVSEALRLDRPRAWLDQALGRGGEPAAGTEPVAGRGMFTPSEERPARLFVAGDSLTDTFAPALVNRVTASGVVEARRETRYSSGLNRPVVDWPAHLAAELAEHPADIVVFMIGANDGVPIQTADGWVGSDTGAWKDAYRARVAAVMDLLAARVATVYWVGLPVVRSEALGRKVAVMNDVFRAEAARQPSLRYVDAWALFAGTDGGYASHLLGGDGSPIQVRRTDGVHFTEAGAERLTDAVWDAIRRDWSIGAWVDAAGTPPTAGTTETTAPPLTSTTAPATTTTSAVPVALARGTRGPAVATLQQRLEGLGYWLGPVDGRFGDNTAHAVVALQKAAGLPRTGVVDAATRAALDAGVRPGARSTGGRTVEIDRDRQLLLVVQDGQVERIFDTSTGRPGLDTPVGRFEIYHQIDVADYAGQYRPKQFHRARELAIHGYGSVLPTPFSHGCARVTLAAMDWLWAKGRVPVGTAVWVY